MNVEPTKMTHEPGDDQQAPQVQLEGSNKSQQPDDVAHFETSQCNSDGNDRVGNNEGRSLQGGSSSALVVVDEVRKEAIRDEESLEEDNGRERLKRHRVAVACRVCIPEIWGYEELLKDWIECSAFDAALVPSRGILSARPALVEEGRRVNSGGFKIENRC
ncbi:hypothetical protein PTKIN_Ptkin13bG0248300 [Pterospermum kingtungense]